MRPNNYKPWGEIVSAPHDDVPRLVYADWLEERGDSRGEFIRLQCRLAQIDETDENWALRRRETALSSENYRVWTAHIEKLPVSQPVFCRGFIEEVTMTANQFLKLGEKVLDELPLLRRIHIKQLKNEFLHQFSAAPALARLTAVSFAGAKVSADDVAAWSPLLESSLPLESLSFSWAKTDVSFQTALFRSPLMRHLQEFRFRDSRLGQTGLESLIFFDNCPNLKKLRLGVNRLASAAGEAIAKWRGLSRLEELEISNNVLGNRGVAAIVNSPYATNLRVLSIGNNRLTKKVVMVLLDSPRLSSLKRLQIDPYALQDKLPSLSERFAVCDWIQ